MPRMTMFPGYDVPGPVGADYLNEEQDTIKRRRLELEKLLSTDQTKGMTGWAGGLSNLALGLAHGYHEGNLGAQEKDLSARRAEAAQKWLDRMPQDTPAQPEFQASIPKQPIVDDEGNPMPSPDVPGQAMGGMVPQPGPQEVYKPATPFLPAPLKDTAKWAMEGAGFSPLHSAIALDAYKTAQDRKKGTADKWEIKKLTLPDGSEQEHWVNTGNISQKPIPIDSPKKPEPKALDQKFNMALRYVKGKYPDKSEAEQTNIAEGLAVSDVVFTATADGGVNVGSKTGGLAGMQTPGTVPTPGAATPPVPGAATTKTPPLTNQQKLEILKPQVAEVLASPESAQKQQNLRELAVAVKNAGGTVDFPVPPPQTTRPDSTDTPLGPGLKSAKAYRDQDPRNRQYIREDDVPGVSMRIGVPPVNAKQLNDDVEKLSVQYGKEKLSELIPAVNQMEATIEELSQKDPRIKRDANGKWTGEAPGFGGPAGVVNVIPSVLVGENGNAMRNVMAVVNDIKLKERSGAAVVTQELERYRTEMAQNLGSNDKLFWDAYHNFKDRLSKAESGVIGGYAPIVRDAYANRPDAVIPMWKRGSGPSEPTKPPPKVIRNAADYNALNIGDEYVAPDGRVDTKKARK